MIFITTFSITTLILKITNTSILIVSITTYRLNQTNIIVLLIKKQVAQKRVCSLHFYYGKKQDVIWMSFLTTNEISLRITKMIFRITTSLVSKLCDCVKRIKNLLKFFLVFLLYFTNRKPVKNYGKCFLFHLKCFFHYPHIQSSCNFPFLSKILRI